MLSNEDIEKIINRYIQNGIRKEISDMLYSMNGDVYKLRDRVIFNPDRPESNKIDLKDIYSTINKLKDSLDTILILTEYIDMDYVVNK